MANVKISELSPLITVQDADVLPIVDNAVTKKVTAAILRSYTEGNSVLLTGAQTVAGIKTFTSQLASSVATGTAPFSVASTTKVTNLNADLLDGLSSADFQATLSGTGIVKSTAGTISYLTDNTANWDTAYNDKINSAAVTGSGTNTLTLTQQDAGTITATWVNGTLIREVRNTTGATLTKGTIVYISGATGNKPTVTKAIASGDSTSAQTFGFIQSDLANNANGYVVVVGDLTGVDTSAFAEGAQLYLSSTVAGTFTDVKQYAPAHLVYVGIVTRSHPTLGQIEVNIQNGYELDELHNVSAQSPSNGDILQYVTSTGLWTKVAGTTTNISEGTNLYFTNARSRSAISESVTGLDYNSTTGVLSTTSGYGIPTTASQATWDTAYNDSIVSAAVTGTTTKTLTLNQQDGGTVTASWTDINTDAVSSVFGRTGAVVAASGDYTTTQVTEGTNLYFTNARAIGSTLTGYLSGAGTITSTDSILGAIQKLNGNIGALVTGVSSVNGQTGAVSLSTTNISEGTNLYYTSARFNSAFSGKTTSDLSEGTNLYYTATRFNTAFSAKSTSDLSEGTNLYFTDARARGAISLTTTGTSGAATYSGGVLNIPQYQAALTNPITGTGTTNYLPKFTGTSALGNSLIYDNGSGIGIGTTSPDVFGRGYAGTILGVSSSSQSAIELNSGTGFGAYFDMGVNGTRTLSIYSDTTSSNIYTLGAQALDFGTNSASRLYITSAGNVGIGTTSPAQKLEVAGIVLAKDNSSYGGAFMEGFNGITYFGSLGSDNIEFYTGGATKMSITSGGNVLIGTTTDAGYKLDVNGTARVKSTGFGVVATFHDTSNNGFQFIADAFNGFNAINATDQTLINISGVEKLRVTSTEVNFGVPITLSNTVAAAVAVASTHKVTVKIGGVTYYLLATNV